MTTGQRRSVEGTRWTRQLFAAAGCALFGVLVHLTSRFLPVQLDAIGLGIGVIGAAFLLAWAADAGEAVFSGGLVLAVIALVTVLPEFVIETRFAYSGQTQLVTANLTGALLMRSADLLLTALNPVGSLIASGLQSHERDEVVRAFRNVRVAWEATEDEWVGLIIRSG